MRIHLLFFGLIILVSSGLFAQNGKIYGRVLDMYAQPAPATKILLKKNGDLFMGALTDEEGRYELKNIPPGEYEVELSTLENDQLTQRVHLNPNENLPVFVNLKQAEREKYICVCIPDYEKKLPLEKRFVFPRNSGVDFSREEIRQISR